MSRTKGIVCPNEFYPTPENLTKALIELVDLEKVNNFLEPCRGDGSISKLINLPEQNKYYAELTEGIDYLKTSFPKVDLIITNPPFSLGTDFIEKSLQELSPRGCACYLLRLNFLGSEKRQPFWRRVGAPNKLLVATPRPSFVNGGTDATEYAWFCWDKGNILSVKEPINILQWDKPRRNTKAK